MKLLTAYIKAAPTIPAGMGGCYLLLPPVPSRLVYVGQTARATFAIRWQEHADALRHGYHVNDALRGLWREHGDLLAVPLGVWPREHLTAWERYWFDEMRRRGYRLANEAR